MHQPPTSLIVCESVPFEHFQLVASKPSPVHICHTQISRLEIAKRYWRHSIRMSLWRETKADKRKREFEFNVLLSFSHIEYHHFLDYSYFFTLCSQVISDIGDHSGVILSDNINDHNQCWSIPNSRQIHLGQTDAGIWSLSPTFSQF